MVVYRRMKYYLIVLLLMLSTTSWAWKWWPMPMDEPDNGCDTIEYVAGIYGVAGTNTGAASLMWQQTKGEISQDSYSGGLHAGVIKRATRPHRWWDADGAAVLNGRVDRHPTGQFSLLYAHARLCVFDITAGVKPMATGPQDPELSMGSFIFSYNAHAFPRITVGIDDWLSFPGAYGYAQFKGSITHGWLNDNNPFVHGTMIHHKCICGRAGGNLPISATIEFHHAAQWGGYLGDINLGNDWASFRNILFARSGGNITGEQINKQGNHMIMQLLSLTGRGRNWSITAYWKDFMDDDNYRFMGYGQNSRDGLWGLRMEQTAWPGIARVTLEFLQTTDQSGPFHDRDGMVYGGNDNYYDNYVYQQGWTYFGRTIGCSAMTPKDSRIMAWHMGAAGNVLGCEYTLKAQYSRHYGTYTVPQNTANTALLLDIRRHVEQAWGLDFGVRLAADFGTTYGNRFSALICVSKSGLIWRSAK